MRKRVKKTGTSLAVILNKEDRDCYNIKDDDVLDMEIKRVIKKKEEKNAK